MADSGGGGGGRCCVCCFKFILTSGLTALFMWLSLHTSDPVCSIQYFYVPALNKTANSPTNTTIDFELKLDNKNKDKGIYYDTLNLTLSYGQNPSFPISNPTFPSFYQGHNKKAHRSELVETQQVPWEEVLGTVSNESTAVFRVNLTTAVRFRIMAWKTKKQKLVVGADVAVDASGEKVYKKGIRLTSGAPELRGHRAPLGPLVVVFTLLFNLVIII